MTFHNFTNHTIPDLIKLHGGWMKRENARKGYDRRVGWKNLLGVAPQIMTVR